MKELPKKHVVSKHGRRGFELDPAILNDRTDILTFLRTRRSCEPAELSAPGPDEETIGLLLEIAARTPDHGKMEPWRFIVIKGAAKDAWAGQVAARWRALNPGREPDRRSDHDIVLRAPVIIAVVSRARPHPRIPQWEQTLSAGAACMNLLSAAIASGLAAQWRSGWMAEDAALLRLLGLEAHETIAGFIYLGARRKDVAVSDRRRPFWRDLTTFWRPPEG